MSEEKRDYLIKRAAFRVLDEEGYEIDYRKSACIENNEMVLVKLPLYNGRMLGIIIYNDGWIDIYDYETKKSLPFLNLIEPTLKYIIPNGVIKSKKVTKQPFFYPTCDDDYMSLVFSCDNDKVLQLNQKGIMLVDGLLDYEEICSCFNIMHKSFSEPKRKILSFREYQDDKGNFYFIMKRFNSDYKKIGYYKT
ncbi:hypothetical protein ACRZ5S_19775 [Vibrio scophthalmi]|uniref:hypothetical protein n=1 Tax=Vibrio TaxID=662 RepID=UPI000BE473D9|nr:hypothetical protein [Vibrio parahaemolyticus]ATI44239.1 hypothetical protein CO725_00875 [Vibrio parahaemolyticus]